MNSPPPLSNFALTHRGMNCLGYLLLIPTARSGIPTVSRPRLPLLRSTHSAPASLSCNLGLPASPQGRKITAHGVSRVEHLAPGLEEAERSSRNAHCRSRENHTCRKLTRFVTRRYNEPPLASRRRLRHGYRRCTHQSSFCAAWLASSASAALIWRAAPPWPCARAGRNRRASPDGYYAWCCASRPWRFARSEERRG